MIYNTIFSSYLWASWVASSRISSTSGRDLLTNVLITLAAMVAPTPRHQNNRSASITVDNHQSFKMCKEKGRGLVGYPGKESEESWAFISCTNPSTLVMPRESVAASSLAALTNSAQAAPHMEEEEGEPSSALWGVSDRIGGRRLPLYWRPRLGMSYSSASSFGFCCDRECQRNAQCQDTTHDTHQHTTHTRTRCSKIWARRRMRFQPVLSVSRMSDNWRGRT